ncbi:GGDEF domain-containing protein [Sphingobium sp. AN558]|uniref:diguanylate cyclase domain-containing protein n=1 Tax=Sphingobium sp. AN558 TaxID=3133442 RepID=UPI0030C2F648
MPDELIGHLSRRRLTAENAVAATVVSLAIMACISNNWFDALCMMIRHNEVYQMDEFIGSAGLLLVGAACMLTRRDRQLRAEMRAIRRSEARNHEIARQDFLTGIPNRFALMERLEDLKGRPLAFLLMDLNGFKAVNDTYGHAVGDLVLKEVAKRLAKAAAILPGVLVARLGGDEFGCLITDPCVSEPEGLSRALLASLREPIAHRGVDLAISTSIGIATSLNGERSVDQLLQDADAAMYHWKANGSGRSHSMQTSRLYVPAELRHETAPCFPAPVSRATGAQI